MGKFYAGFWIRLFAGALDLLFLTPLILLIIYFSGDFNYQFFSFSDSSTNYKAAEASSVNRFANLITYLLSIAYVAYFLSGKSQATPGKKLLGIYVGNPDGSRLPMAKCLARAGCALITSATLGLGFVIVIFTKEKISLHDFLCNTRVFYGKKNVE